jgi:hypothetical protein
MGEGHSLAGEVEDEETADDGDREEDGAEEIDAF